jgi:hypothetical protein
MTLLATVETGVVIILPAGVLPMTLGLVLGSTFIGPWLGVAFTGGLLLLHARQPLLLYERQLAAHTSRWVDIFIIPMSFDHTQQADDLSN